MSDWLQQVEVVSSDDVVEMKSRGVKNTGDRLTESYKLRLSEKHIAMLDALAGEHELSKQHILRRLIKYAYDNRDTVKL